MGAIEIYPKVSFSDLDKDMNAFIKEADALLYRAKQNGRNRLECEV